MAWLRALAAGWVALAASPSTAALTFTIDTSMQAAPVELWTVDLESAETTAWTGIENLGPGSWNGLSVHTSEPGVLYAVNNPRPPVFDDPQTSRLSRIDLTTGAVTMFPLYDEATLGFAEPFATAIAIQPGETSRAYVGGSAIRLGERYLWQVELASGEAVGPAVRVPDDVDFRSMTFDPSGQTLWGADGDGRVFTIDPATAAIQVVAETDLDWNIEGLDFDPYTGRLYLIEAGTSDRLRELDPTTGELIASIGKVGIGGPEGLAFLTTPGDVNGDDKVDLADFNVLKTHFNGAGLLSQGDLDRDGVVDLEDFSLLKDHFGDSGPVPAPEPSGLLLAAVGGLLVAGAYSRSAISASRR